MERLLRDDAHAPACAPRRHAYVMHAVIHSTTTENALQYMTFRLNNQTNRGHFK